MACAKALGQEGVDCVGGPERRAERQGWRVKVRCGARAGSPRAAWARPASGPDCLRLQDAHLCQAPVRVCRGWGVVVLCLLDEAALCPLRT